MINDHRVKVVGRSATLPRFPPRPLLYTGYGNAVRILPLERDRLTFVLVKAEPGQSPRELAERIQQRTGLRARAAEDFKADTVRWYLINSEDVGDMAAMLALAMTVGLGVTGVMLYMFTYDSLKQYAVLKAMGASTRLLLLMVFTQAGVSALLGAGIGVGVCALIGQAVSLIDYPFRMLWLAPCVGSLGVLIVALAAATVSVRPLLKLDPSLVFAGR